MTKTINGYEIKPLSYLRGAYLRGANLRGADLRGANLRGADLRGADLYGADLYGADLYGANLRGADLRGADLYGADLYDADLYGANLRGAKNIPDQVRAATQVLPDEGDVIGWKKCCNNVVVKLLIKSKTPRSSATTRKCRAKEAEVLSVFGGDFGVSKHDGKTLYKAGDTVVCDTWCEDRWDECAGGIHFFITRQEAEDY